MLKKTLAILFIMAVAIVLLGVGYVFVVPAPDSSDPAEQTLIKKNESPIEVTLEFWGLWDNSDNWEEIIKRFESETHNFNGQKVKVSVNYTKKEFGFYEEDFSKAEQKNAAPNIFVINNNWLEKYIEQLEPLDGNEKYVKEYELIKYEELLDIFHTETVRNLIYNDKLYGLPMDSDSLALYYNKDLFAEAEIDGPPQTWNEFKESAKKLTEFDKNGNITRSGTALGCGKNVNRSADILSLLMMQGGAKVIDSGKNIDINKETEVNSTDGIKKRTPGKRAIMFYTEFSNPEEEIYTWNCEQEEAIRLFAGGKMAMFLGYGYQIKNLLALNPDLNYGIAKMPQLENSTIVNFSNAWTPVVAKGNNCQVKPIELSDKIDCSKIAWSFLSFASQKENAEIYSSSTEKAAARKDIAEEQITLDNKISVFAAQAESAMSYNKFDDRIDGILVEMIDEINIDRENSDEIINEAVEKIEELKNNYK